MSIGAIGRGAARWTLTAFLALGLVAAPATAQISTIDPNEAIDADLAPVQEPVETGSDASNPMEYRTPYDGIPTTATEPAQDSYAASQGGGMASAQPVREETTYQKDDLIGAAEGIFGKGAEGLGGLIEDILRNQGEPNGYIVGREAGGALVIGVRYGSGTLYHKVEGEQNVYWTGPSIGFDAGANAGNTFVLVYNLYDTEDLYKRYGAGEGAAYLVGGFHASYLRRGDTVLIPVRLGVGVRLGANIGYMKFSKKQRWLPF